MHDVLKKALEMMHRAGFAPSVGEVAVACGLSPFQLARLFSAGVGVAPGAYMGRVRLERAAASLRADPEISLADAAFDAGFESQQTFTRAFKRQFGVAPGRYRKEKRMPISTPMTKAKPRELPILLRAQKVLSPMGPMRVAGFTVHVDGSGKERPPDAWAKLDTLLPVAGQEPGYAVGVCWADANDESFTYMAGVVLQKDAPAPPRMVVCDIPAQTYAIIRQRIRPGPYVEQLQAGIKALWSERVPRMKLKPSGGPDFEIYPDALVGGKTSGWVEYRIPVLAAA